MKEKSHTLFLIANRISINILFVICQQMQLAYFATKMYKIVDSFPILVSRTHILQSGLTHLGALTEYVTRFSERM